ncbi:chloramphenicol phosphotransferase [Streptomyces diastatochromogenes]|nr:chloramphenicol phosphotransferase [Streptomyces diastatochromogenes]
MATRMIILNGGSSSGKTGIVRCLQAVLPDPWLAFGVDSFVDALPARMRDSDGGIAFDADGTVSVGADFRALEAAWAAGIVAMARAGARIVVDDVFLGGPPPSGAGARPSATCPCCGSASGARARSPRTGDRPGDRVPGMAAQQALLVHEGVTYDVEVDTTRTESVDCARTIAAALG